MMHADSAPSHAWSEVWLRPLWAAVVLLAMAMFSIVWIDGPVIRWIQDQQMAWYKNPWVAAYVQLGKAWVIVWLLCLATWRRGIRQPLLAALVALAMTALVVTPLKPITSRMRPAVAMDQMEDSGVPLKAAGRYSFPSGDTAAVFAAAVSVAGLSRRRQACVLLACAGTIGLLRVVSVNHWPSDVMAGAAIGVLCAVAGTQFVQRHPRLQTRLADHWARRFGLAGMVVILILSVAIEVHSSVVLFLRYYGPILAAGWAILSIVQRRGHGPMEDAQAVAPTPAASRRTAALTEVHGRSEITDTLPDMAKEGTIDPPQRLAVQ